MDIERIKVGKRVIYKSRAYEGRAVVERIDWKKTGYWITVLDKARNKLVTVRPSQLRSA